jgi:hypothetical protein
MKGKAFLVVGHTRWGKSSTLKALTDDRPVWYWKFQEKTFFVKRMSNDDGIDQWRDAVSPSRPEKHPLLVVAMCPNEDAVETLEGLSCDYDLNFWVIRHQFAGNGVVTDDQLKPFLRLGTFEIFGDKRAEAEARGQALRTFIKNSL